MPSRGHLELAQEPNFGWEDIILIKKATWMLTFASFKISK